MTRKRFAAVGAGKPVRPDFGPEIRLVSVEAAPGQTREADVELAKVPDPDHPDRRQDITRAVRWLPLRLHYAGHLSKDQLRAAQWYRDLIDDEAGVVDRTVGFHQASMPSRRSLLTDRMVEASIKLQDADRAMGVERVRLMRVAVTASSKTEIALAAGIATASVPAACAKVFELLDEWRARYGGGR